MSRAIFFFALFFFSTDSASGQFVPIQKKSIWVTRESMYTPMAIDSALSYAAELDFDRVFVQVRGRGDALYNSRYVVKNQKVLAGFDPLAYAIELGHELDLEVHAWMNVYILWSGKTQPAQAKHVLLMHPEWTEANSFGKMDWRIDATRPPSPNWEGVYLAPQHPEVNPYLAGIVSEVIENYQVDGIHFDYIRYQDDYYGYNPEGRQKFEEVYDIDPIDISRGVISTRFGWEQAFVDSMQYAWQQFRQDKVTDLIRLVRNQMESSGTSVLLSAAVKPDFIRARERWSQDWQLWLNEGLLDFVVPMNYFKDIATYSQNLILITDHFPKESLDMITIGVATYNQDAESVADKILLARLNGFTSICIFSYDSHKNNLDWMIPVINSF